MIVLFSIVLDVPPELAARIGREGTRVRLHGDPAVAVAAIVIAAGRGAVIPREAGSSAV